MIKWKQIYKRLPAIAKTARHTSFEVLWLDQFPNDPEQHGETRQEPPQIIMAKNWPQKEQVHTFFHEYLHALDFTHEIGLTEKQVEKLEKCLPQFIELFNTLLKDR